MRVLILLVVCGLFLALSRYEGGEKPDDAVLEEVEKRIPSTQLISTHEDLRKDSAGVLLYREVPYSGYLVDLNTEGQVMLRQGYFEGKLDGEMLAYYASGALRFKRPYTDGQKHGAHIAWYEDGQMKFLYHFDQGRSVGNHKEWYPDGSLFQDLNYQDGRPFGAQKIWRRDGKIRANYVIRENGKRYGLMGIKRCTKIDGEKEEIDPYKGIEN
ncbi:MAG: hypothetical protein RIC30_20030 [Marinoscillum sp.]|uniref:toxin-antitoxin system YwqK family antitoxin n=1 Tax=Marinoscillum sp. TaxID=2024838 RepID=UPI003303B328